MGFFLDVEISSLQSFFWRVCVFVMILLVTHLIAVRLDAFL